MKKKNLILIVCLIISLAFTSCAANDDNYAPEMQAAEKSIAYDMADGDMYYGEDEESSRSGSDAGDAVDYSEKIIYNVNMGIVADDPVETSKQIKQKVSEMGGYVSSSYTNKGEGYTNHVNMQVRIPSNGLNDMTVYIASISDVDYENMYTDNITESYYDTVTRLEHEKLQAKQLEELLEKAETIEEILIVRQELSRVQENIEVYEGRIRMWDSLVDYSTVDINISQTQTIDNNSGLIRVITLGETGRGIVRALNNSWRFLANLLSFLLRVIAALIIPAVIIVPIVIIIVRTAKKNKAKRNNNNMNR